MWLILYVLAGLAFAGGLSLLTQGSMVTSGLAFLVGAVLLSGAVVGGQVAAVRREIQRLDLKRQETVTGHIWKRASGETEVEQDKERIEKLHKDIDKLKRTP